MFPKPGITSISFMIYSYQSPATKIAGIIHNLDVDHGFSRLLYGMMNRLK